MKDQLMDPRNTTPHQYSVPLTGPLQVYKYQVHLKSPIHKVQHHWEPKVYKEQPDTGLLPCTSWTQQSQPLQVQTTTPCFQPTNTLVSFCITTEVRSDVPIPPYLWTQLHPLPQWKWCPFWKTQVWVLWSIHKVHHNLRSQLWPLQEMW